MKRSTKRIIIILCSVVGGIFVLLLLFIGLIFGCLAIYNSSKPDNRKDTLIPKGYVETDGRQSFGAGDWETVSYFTYSEMPELDSRFKPITDESLDEVEIILDHYRYSYEEPSLLNPNLIYQRLSADDYYYIRNYNGGTQKGDKYGAFFYYYDTQDNVLFKIDYCW